MSTSTKTSKIVVANLKPSKKFGESELLGALSIDRLDGQEVQDLIYTIEGKRYLNIKVMKRRSPSEKGKTHYIELDTFVPEKKGDV